MIRVDKSTEDKLVQMQKDMGLEGPELTKRGDFHTTIRYITTDKSPDLILGYLEGSKLPILKGKVYGQDIFGPTKDTLVLRIESKEIDDWFKRFNKFVVSNDYPRSKYPTFKPHLSLNIKEGITKPKWKDKYAIDLRFTIHVVTGKNYKDMWLKDASKITMKEAIVNTFINSKQGD
jgi:hypothetical protein